MRWYPSECTSDAVYVGLRSFENNASFASMALALRRVTPGKSTSVYSTGRGGLRSISFQNDVSWPAPKLTTCAREAPDAWAVRTNWSSSSSTAAMRAKYPGGGTWGGTQTGASQRTSWQQRAGTSVDKGRPPAALGYKQRDVRVVKVPLLHGGAEGQKGGGAAL